LTHHCVGHFQAKEVSMGLLVGMVFFDAMVWGLLLMIGWLTGLVVQGNWKMAAFIVGMFVGAGVAGKILAEVFIFVSDAMK
jgi:hypothetical protein